jgi:hypothetical protein
MEHKLVTTVTKACRLTLRCSLMHVNALLQCRYECVLCCSEQFTEHMRNNDQWLHSVTNKPVQYSTRESPGSCEGLSLHILTDTN